MANWNKLNAEIDAVLKNMTSENWAEWKRNRENNKLMRSTRMAMDANLHFQRLALTGQFVNMVEETSQILISNNVFLSIPTSSVYVTSLFMSGNLEGKSELSKIAFADNISTEEVLVVGNTNFAMAA
jgi:hypothetical protein